jgi:S-adenosylmethionine:tRNA ribosyltransferase-isomerase
MDLDSFNYHLPKNLIAQYPKERGSSRLIVIDRANKQIHHKRFSDFFNYIENTDCIVLNDTKVIPARLLGKKTTGGRVEILLVKEIGQGKWQCLVKSSKPVRQGEVVYIDEDLAATAQEKQGDQTIFSFSHPDRIFAKGHVPLPPYIDRLPEEIDREAYQTVYAKNDGSVAAPTAGLHFDHSALDTLKDKGADIVRITLKIGPGTFQPVRTQRVEDHVMAEEYFSVSEESANKINSALKQKKRIIAVGTTTTRVIEHLLKQNKEIVPGSGATDVFIYPGFTFNGVGALLTNLHLPCSTLLMLACAFGGYDLIMEAYRQAVEKEYRFFSYGDAMFIF